MNLTNVCTSVIQPPVKIYSISLSTFSAPSFLSSYGIPITHMLDPVILSYLSMKLLFFPHFFPPLYSSFFLNVKHLICCSFGAI